MNKFWVFCDYEVSRIFVCLEVEVKVESSRKRYCGLFLNFL